MTTERQSAANRINALTSTGPRTETGKAIVARNATRLGIYALSPVVNGLETADEWQAYRAGILDDLAPAGLMEEALAERVAGCLWRLRRVIRGECGAIESSRADVLVDLHSTNKTKLDLMQQLVEEARRGAYKLKRLRIRITAWRKTAAFLLSLDGRQEDEPLDGSELYEHLRRFTERLVRGFGSVLVGEQFLDDVGAPPTANADAGRWLAPGWTVGHARRALAQLRESGSGEATVGEALQGLTKKAEEEFKAIDAKIIKKIESVAEMDRRLKESAVLPDEATLAKIARYESHLSRQLTGALHELQRLQAARRGGHVPPPAALDVTLHVGNGEAQPHRNGFAKQSQLAGT